MIQRILIADDDEDDKELFADALRQVSTAVELSTVANGIELLSALRTASALPDVIFLDLNMPVRNGHESLRDIRQDARLAGLPVIIFSTSAHPHTIEQMYSLGATYYIEKPSDFIVLKQLIKTIITSSITNSPPTRIEFTKYMK